MYNLGLSEQDYHFPLSVWLKIQSTNSYDIEVILLNSIYQGVE